MSGRSPQLPRRLGLQSLIPVVGPSCLPGFIAEAVAHGIEAIYPTRESSGFYGWGRSIWMVGAIVGSQREDQKVDSIDREPPLWDWGRRFPVGQWSASPAARTCATGKKKSQPRVQHNSRQLRRSGDQIQTLSQHTLLIFRWPSDVSRITVRTQRSFRIVDRELQTLSISPSTWSKRRWSRRVRCCSGWSRRQRSRHRVQTSGNRRNHRQR